MLDGSIEVISLEFASFDLNLLIDSSADERRRLTKTNPNWYLWTRRLLKGDKLANRIYPRSPGLWSPLLYSFHHHHLHQQSWTGGHEAGARYNRTQSQDIASQGGCACIWWIYLRVARAFCSFWVCWNLEPNDKKHPSWHRWAHRRKSLRRYASLDPEAPKHRSTQGKRPHLRTTGGQPMPKGLTQMFKRKRSPNLFLARKQVLMSVRHVWKMHF